MGLCKSRQQKPNYAIPQKMIAKDPPFPAFRAPPGLGKPSSAVMRADAQPFSPTQPSSDGDCELAVWEKFLEKKQATVNAWKKPTSAPISPDVDGSFTSRYQDMLGSSGRNPRRAAGDGEFDILQSWRSAAPRARPFQYVEEEAKKRKPSTLKKQILAQRKDGPAGPNPLWAKFAEQLERAKGEKGPVAVVAPATKDDEVAAATAHRQVPYGLADRCYLSDTEDAADAQRHVSASHAPIRDYVDTCVTPELEDAVTACLYRLRQLKRQDTGIDNATTRYVIGFREVDRALQHKKVAALVVAPDVEESGGALEKKIAALKTKGEDAGVPVVFALSRRQLGAALQKSMAVSVLAVLETKGAEDLVEQMRVEAARARDIGA